MNENQSSDAKTDFPEPQVGSRGKNVLIRFRHGLGDAVQLTTVLQHLRHDRRGWNVDVAAAVGKHSAFHGLCRQAFLLGRDAPSVAEYDEVFDLMWPECPACYSDHPSTKAERCLLETFGITPEAARCTYSIGRGEQAKSLARRYFERTCQVAVDDAGRYPVVLIHYEGNTAHQEKDLPVDMIARVCEDIIECGSVPVILDWDYRTPLADGKRIFNPHVDLELWGGTGTGDAEVLAALTELASLMVGIDSGPLHVAAATSTPAVGVWTGHHPLHYIGLADNLTHLVPQRHTELLRGDLQTGEAYFGDHYRYRTYTNLEDELRAVVRERLQNAGGALFFTRNFWIRTKNAKQDLVVVEDIAERDSYRVAELPMPRPVIVDVGAHIGCFSKRLHQRNPLARIIAVECCPENIPALQKNVGDFAEVIQAAVTYESDVALQNAVYDDCVTTGGSMLVGREALGRKVAAGEIDADPANRARHPYWADLRPITTVTLEQILAERGIDVIDVLKLDCEGSEFSILGQTALLDRIGMIIGEYHGKTRFLKLVLERFAGWELRILQDGELGAFWLTRFGVRR